MLNFEIELTNLINKYSAENGSDTPDYILAAYLRRTLETFNAAVSSRDRWYGVKKDENTHDTLVEAQGMNMP